MATLVNKLNREVKVIIPNMREFRVFYSDNEGSVMFFKRDWVEVREEHWKPSEEQLKELNFARLGRTPNVVHEHLDSLYNDLLKLKSL